MMANSPVSFMRLDQPLPGKQVIRPDTARKMRDMLMTVTQPGGTAPRAQVLGFTCRWQDRHGAQAGRPVTPPANIFRHLSALPWPPARA